MPQTPPFAKYIIEDLWPHARPIDDLKIDPANAMRHEDQDLNETASSLHEFKQRTPIVINTTDDKNIIEKGNGTWLAAKRLGWTHIAAVGQADDPMTHVRYGIADNATGRIAEWDAETLDALLQQQDDPTSVPGVTAELVAAVAEELKLLANGGEGSEGADTEPEIDRAAELAAEWGVELGQVWRLGENHRLICGDCTDAEVVAAVMGGQLAALCQADPPYGMGKEKDGIINDNLYHDKLDAFQMAWWQAGRQALEDNASAYIWGNAENLWRLWYVGGLRDSERLTLRNEIVWAKGDAGAGGISHQGAEGLRLYPQETERCLFFMLGEQGFNINADNYWEGWESLRLYLKGERDVMGWDNAKCKSLAGHSPTSGCHWFDSSQWNFVTEDVYAAWQQAAKGAAFKRDYDELKRDFYSTRAYFDNAHDNMTDVWQFDRVKGEERWQHATPKPVAMIERIIKSSSTGGAIVYSPFCGSGSDLIACENLGRCCRAIEINPGYVAVTLQRYLDHTDQRPELTSA